MSDRAQKPDLQRTGADYKAFKKQLREPGSALEEIATAQGAEALKWARDEAQKLLTEVDALVGQSE